MAASAQVDYNYDHYVLMEDIPGERAVNTLVSMMKKSFVGGNSSQQTIVLRGEILCQIPPNCQLPRSEGLAHNYYVDKDPSITLVVPYKQGVSPLPPEEYQLLKAIDSTFDRFNVFVNSDWLEWGVKLKVNDQVYVRLPGPNLNPDWSLAIVRYKGEVKSLPGINFGVEICVG